MLCSLRKQSGVGCAGPGRLGGGGPRVRGASDAPTGISPGGVGSRAGVQTEALDHIAKCVSSNKLKPVTETDSLLLPSGTHFYDHLWIQV